jgi:hypothetical protein
MDMSDRAQLWLSGLLIGMSHRHPDQRLRGSEEGAEMSELDQELEASGRALLEAAHAHYEVMRKKGIAGGCIWLCGKDGNMVIFTRGEYRSQLLRNIETEFDAKRMYMFGRADTNAADKPADEDDTPPLTRF